jgi:hypothetical protein
MARNPSRWNRADGFRVLEAFASDPAFVELADYELTAEHFTELGLGYCRSRKAKETFARVMKERYDVEAPNV